MRFHIRHSVSYRYDGLVFLEPQRLHFRPRCDHTQDVKSFRLRVEPEPSLLSEVLNAEGNSVAQAWFLGQTTQLDIEANVEVETLRVNPFDYMLTEARFERLPFEYARDLQLGLQPYRSASHEVTIQRFAQLIASEVDQRTLPFVTALNQQIAALCRVEQRDLGPPALPAVTLERREGACRDLAELFVATCQAVGLAARFVSGYRFVDGATGSPDLHAWAEVYLPGGGWRGYDPTSGLAVADQHVAVAASYEPARTLPVSGTYRGTGVTAAISYDVQIAATALVPA